MKIPATRTRPLFAGAIAAAGLSLGACSGTPDSFERAAQIRANPTPDLATMALREVQLKNELAVTFDENIRMAREDLRRLLLLDRQSRLTRFPVPR
ncbi:MAG: hypothetical protein AAGB51_05755 [Planctomycetota bacterium]